MSNSRLFIYDPTIIKGLSGHKCEYNPDGLVLIESGLIESVRQYCFSHKAISLSECTYSKPVFRYSKKFNRVILTFDKQKTEIMNHLCGVNYIISDENLEYLKKTGYFTIESIFNHRPLDDRGMMSSVLMPVCTNDEYAPEYEYLSSIFKSSLTEWGIPNTAILTRLLEQINGSPMNIYDKLISKFI